jgi:uncharacterized protein
VTFVPGELNTTVNGLRLSSGLTSRIFARSGQRAQYWNRNLSQEQVHTYPDFGACFVDANPQNAGGWIYLSNSEDRNKSLGGVGSFVFNAAGELIKYGMALTKTTSNCGGGVTPWETYISCEETDGGLVWQVDPHGIRTPQVITLGSEGGQFESFAYDLVTSFTPQFFVTEDDKRGPLRRWIPAHPNWSDPWSILTGNGTTDYLMLHPANGTFSWTSDKNAAQDIAEAYFPNSEGIDCYNGTIYFVSKVPKLMYVLNLRSGRYETHPTNIGDFDGQPDQLVRMFRDDDQLLFFTEDGGDRPGIYARRKSSPDVIPIAESSIFVNMDQETTGLAFSPDRRHLYFAIQDAGIFYDVTRLDGLPFDARSLNVQYRRKA